jgi:hypothetical protein
MDRNINPRHIHTAPIALHTVVSKRARFLSELDRAERRIRLERERIGKQVESEKAKYNIAINLGPQTTLGTKVGHAFCSILAEWNYDSEVPKLLHALRLIRKLRAAINGGALLRESSDVELAFVRKVMSGITT